MQLARLSTTTHQPAFFGATHLLLGEVNLMLRTRHTADWGDMDTYFVMYPCTRGVWHLYYNSNCYTCKQSKFCILQGTVETLFM